MDSVIIGAIIGIVGAIAAAIITSWRSKGKKKSLSNKVFFGLGNHLSLLGWVKNEKTTEDRLRSVHTMPLTMMDILRFPSRVISEFKEFLAEKVDLDKKRKMEELVERMLTLRNLFAVTIRNKFGRQEENIFQFGFTLTNLIYMCENPSAMVENKDFIKNNLSVLLKESHDLGLPTGPIEESLDIYCKVTNTGKPAELYSKLCKCVVVYEKALEKK